MAKYGFKAMDSDMHVFEPADLWQRYIDKKNLERAPKGLNRAFRDLGVEVEGKILPIPRKPENPALAKYRQDFFEEKYGEAGKRNVDGVSQLQAMDKEGLDIGKRSGRCGLATAPHFSTPAGSSIRLPPCAPDTSV